MQLRTAKLSQYNEEKIMPKLLQMDFPYTGPFGHEMTAALTELANSIAAVLSSRYTFCLPVI